MKKEVRDKIYANGFELSIYTNDFQNEYSSLTDIAKYQLGVWEMLHNPNFNRVQFDTVENAARLNRFVMTPTKRVESMSALQNIKTSTLPQHSIELP